MDSFGYVSKVAKSSLPGNAFNNLLARPNTKNAPTIIPITIAAQKNIVLAVVFDAFNLNSGILLFSL